MGSFCRRTRASTIPRLRKVAIAFFNWLACAGENLAALIAIFIAGCVWALAIWEKVSGAPL